MPGAVLTPRAVRVRTSEGWQDIAIVGPQGDTGPQGPPGVDGPPGATVVTTTRGTYTFTIPGAVAVPAGDTDYICGFFIAAAAGKTPRLIECRHRINSGTSATVKVQKNGADITGFTGISVTPTSTLTDPADQNLAHGDYIALVVTAVSGSPQNLSLTLVVDQV